MVEEGTKGKENRRRKAKVVDAGWTRNRGVRIGTRGGTERERSVPISDLEGKKCRTEDSSMRLLAFFQRSDKRCLVRLIDVYRGSCIGVVV